MPLELLKSTNVLALGFEILWKEKGSVLSLVDNLGDSLGFVKLYAVREEVWNAVDRTWRRPSRKPEIARAGRTIKMLDILEEPGIKKGSLNANM